MPAAGAGALDGVEFVGTEFVGAGFVGLACFGSFDCAVGASGSSSSGFGVGFATGPGPLRGTSSFFCGAPPVANTSFGFFAIAAFMKSIHIGSAARAPVSFSPSVSRLSKPIHVPQVTDGENPMNHASV